jgi:hypothetical protein
MLYVTLLKLLYVSGALDVIDHINDTLPELGDAFPPLA